jgi:hypothetical protein
MCKDGDGDPVVLYNNTVYSPTGKITECGMPLAKWQEKGNDNGTTANTYPDDEVLLAIMAANLNMPANWSEAF